MSAALRRPGASPLVRPGAVGWTGALMLFSLVATALGHRVAPLPPIAPARIQEQRLLVFEDRVDGAVIVRDAARQPPTLIDIVTGPSGFLRGVLRGFAAARHAAGIGRAPPLRLSRLSDGTLHLDDPTTGRGAALDAFGPDNAAVFARYLIPPTKRASRLREPTDSRPIKQSSP